MRQLCALTFCRRKRHRVLRYQTVTANSGVAPDAALELRRSVELLAADPALRARLGEAGRRAVLGRTWEALGDRLIEHYGATISRVGAARRPQLVPADL